MPGDSLVFLFISIENEALLAFVADPNMAQVFWIHVAYVIE
jgi:hypothetical protein